MDPAKIVTVDGVQMIRLTDVYDFVGDLHLRISELSVELAQANVLLRNAKARRSPQDAPGAVIQRPRRPERAARVGFRALTPANAHHCHRERPDGSRCPNMAATWHHWIPQNEIRQYIATRSRLMTPDKAKRALRQLLADPRNLSAFCVDCHLSSEPLQPQWSGFRPFTRAEVPESAIQFAAELGLLSYIDRRYPD